MKVFFLLIFITACSTGLLKGQPKEGKSIYSYVDETGTYTNVRESKVSNNRIITRNQLLSSNQSSKLLEKSILVSQIGSIKTKGKRLLTVRPMAAEYTVWIEGKKYYSRMEIKVKNKTMSLDLNSPEAKWQGNVEVPFPKGKYFCFFNQIPECLYHNYLLQLARDYSPKEMEFILIWDSYPYLQDLLSKVGRKLFAVASVKFDGEINGLFRYIVEVEGQVIHYQFTKNYDLVKVAWIAQGITIAPPGQEIVEDE